MNLSTLTGLPPQNQYLFGGDDDEKLGVITGVVQQGAKLREIGTKKIYVFNFKKISGYFGQKACELKDFSPKGLTKGCLVLFKIQSEVITSVRPALT